MTTAKNKDYMELMEDFLDLSIRCKESEDASEDILLTHLQAQKEAISNIATLTRSTNLFQDSKERYEEFKKVAYENDKGKQRIIFVYTHLLIKIVNAPTRLHMRGVVILLMPLLDEVLSEGEDV